MGLSIRTSGVFAAMLLVGFVAGVACNQAANEPVSAKEKQAPAADATAPKVQRFGSVIGLKKDKKDFYNKLHANPWPEVNAMLKKCNIRNYSIYETEIDGKLYLFSYFEYVGDDLKADMERLSKDETIKKWWKECDPCQIKLPDTPAGEQWKGMEEVYHLD
jgi:L-rhamnose mutarotase